jgi:hypothetical protein
MAQIVRPSCMIEKSQLNDKPESIKRPEKPLAKGDLISSSVTSIEGYNYCAVLTDDCTDTSMGIWFKNQG